MARTMLFVDRDRGLVEVEVDNQELASFIGRHHYAIRARLKGDEGGGDDTALEPFENQRVKIGGQTFRPETDVDVLVDLYWAGELDYQDPYDVGFLEQGTEEAGDGGE